MKHTPEPWFVHNNGYFFDITIGGQYDEAIGNTCQSKCIWGAEVEAANAARIVACVNAMAGIENPAKFVGSMGELVDQNAELREKIESLESENENLNIENDTLLARVGNGMETIDSLRAQRDELQRTVARLQVAMDFVDIRFPLVLSGLITETNDISFRPTDILLIAERMQGNKRVKVAIWEDESI